MHTLRIIIHKMNAIAIYRECTVKKVFIDGKAGTTGLRIYERLEGRSDITLLTLSDDDRKEPTLRRSMLNSADIAFLCLPDAAAIEAVQMVENPDTVVIDTSTAHRTAPGWIYGFPELSPEIRSAIPHAKRIAVPGCHAGGFIALVRPLIESGAIAKDARLTCHSITGYSGGGKKMIAEYEGKERSPLLGAPRQYGLTQNHKHLREMKAITGLEHEPIFCPIVADFYSGMEVTVPLFAEDLAPGFTADSIREIYKSKYIGPIVTFDSPDESAMLPAAGQSGLDSMKIAVLGNSERILLTALYDNLGKGASGAAVEVMNIVLGVSETTGLSL